MSARDFGIAFCRVKLRLEDRGRSREPVLHLLRSYGHRVPMPWTQHPHRGHLGYWHHHVRTVPKRVLPHFRMPLSVRLGPKNDEYGLFETGVKTNDVTELSRKGIRVEFAVFCEMYTVEIESIILGGQMENPSVARGAPRGWRSSIRQSSTHAREPHSGSMAMTQRGDNS